MLFDVNVVPEPQFSDLAINFGRTDRVLNRDGYEEFAKQSIPKEKMIYRPEDPSFFHAVATQEIPPGPGPQLTTNLAPQSGAGDAR